MAKFSSSAWKRKRPSTSSFSKLEMDVARQLMLLCQEYNHFCNDKAGDESNQLAKKEESENESNRSGSESLVSSLSSNIQYDPFEMEDEEENLQPRKRRFKSIDLLYSSTKPLSISTRIQRR
ncbi:hypothetical protein CCACVL1_29594 [Corchorus capsularis]|uniref:Uncharacterized protein n=1 Tax=Corchorus capsularis TaxID=210143 RepID=A0A1R3G123_COCAP|nr:hypothetical protein CCACVL1_29594 [Corchorus capsularis]